MKLNWIVGLVLCAVMADAASSQAAPSSSPSDEQRFVQSVMYRPLAEWCDSKIPQTDLRKAYRVWYDTYKLPILNGAKRIEQQAKQRDKTAEETINALIHIQEVEFWGLNEAQQMEKCEKLTAFFTK